MSSEKIFITGGTGNIGTRLVNTLLSRNASVTLYARDAEKVRKLFPNHGSRLQVIEGSFENLDPLKEGIRGHSRLFLLVRDLGRLAEIKGTIARYAYEAGVKQIVDISTVTIDSGWRVSSIGEAHQRAEQAILDVPRRGRLVALRPNRFFSNHIAGPSSLQNDVLYDSVDANVSQGWISTNDIADFAAAILQDDIEKHQDKVYNLTSELLTGNQRAEILSRVTGRKVKYVQDALKRYNFISQVAHYPHIYAIDLIDTANGQPEVPVNPAIEIVLQRKPETFEQYLKSQKQNLQ